MKNVDRTFTNCKDSSIKLALGVNNIDHVLCRLRCVDIFAQLYGVGIQGLRDARREGILNISCYNFKKVE